VDVKGHIEALGKWIPDENTWLDLFIHTPEKLFA
jgi:hypothetical protein